MGTTAQKLQKVLTSKNAIKTAIKNKTGVDPGDKMSTYATKINDLEIQTEPFAYGEIMEGFNTVSSYGPSVKFYLDGDGTDYIDSNFKENSFIYSFNLEKYLGGIPLRSATECFCGSDIRVFSFGDADLTSQPNLNEMFNGCVNLHTVNFPKKLTASDCSYMFANTAALKEFNLDELDVHGPMPDFLNSSACENVSINKCDYDWSSLNTGDASYMFYSMLYLTNINLNNFNFKNVNCSNFLSGNSNLTSLNITNSNFTDCQFDYAFHNCTAITTIDFSQCVFAKDNNPDIYVSNMFKNCKKLTSLTILDDLSLFTGTGIFDGVTTTGKFYYDPYFVPEGESITQYSIVMQKPSKWTMVPVEYIISSVTATASPLYIVNQFETSIPIQYDWITNGTVGSRVITGRQFTGITSSSTFTQNTTGKDRNLNVTYTVNGVSKTISITQKYLEPTLSITDGWVIDETGGYFYQGPKDENSGGSASSVLTIPEGLREIYFEFEISTEYGYDGISLSCNQSVIQGLIENSLGFVSGNYYPNWTLNLVEYEGDNGEPVYYEGIVWPIQIQIDFTSDGSGYAGNDNAWFTFEAIR